MITPSLLAETASQLEGETLDDVLFDLFEEMFENRIPQLSRIQMWDKLDRDPRTAEEFARYVRAKLAPQGNEPTLELRRNLRDKYFRKRLDRLTGIWKEVTESKAAAQAEDQESAGRPREAK